MTHDQNFSKVPAAADRGRVIEGRARPPTAAEIEAHCAAGNVGWLIRYRNTNGCVFWAAVRLCVMNGGPFWSTFGSPDPKGWIYTRTGLRAGLPVAEFWWPLDAAGPCAWPVVDGATGDAAHCGGGSE